ncbi:uncharacterized protein LOC114254615 [Monomorium pharaonis]|uniref:uncharacterized protein LOC114254615 n=1 Tax=Monomorium pharaonis TaxID=307658 RepID=UPI001746E0B2|nr:uncharacterized protein LOC114254615 [Monomorium pharaonis]
MDLLVLWNAIFNNNEKDENVLQVRRIREQHIRISQFYENVILNYSLTDFKSHFRVTRGTFQLLIQHIGPTLLQRDNCPKILPDKLHRVMKTFAVNLLETFRKPG